MVYEKEILENMSREDLLNLAKMIITDMTDEEIHQLYIDISEQQDL